MSITGFVYELGTIVDCDGAGSGAAQLTGSFTPATKIAVNGVGDFRLRGVSVFGGGATSVTLRLMDYTDASNPTVIAVVDPADPASGAQAAVTFGSAGAFALEANLGGVVGVVCVEKKAGGSPAAGDTITASAFGSEKF